MPSAVINKMVELSGREVGYREGPRNNETKYGAEFGFNFVAWCAIWACIMCKWAGVTYLGKTPRFPSTCAWRDHAKKNGRWSTTPRVGSVAMRAYTASTGHVGIAVGIGRDGTIYTREGNTNAEGAREGNGVWNRARAGFWHGYIILDEGDGGTPQPPPPPPAPTPGGGLAVDGDFGPNTVKGLQRRLNETEPGNDLVIDGDMAQRVSNKNVTFPPGVKTNTAGYLQQRLNWGAGPVSIDGEVGPNTIKALQRYVGVGQDGQWGPQTTMALQRKLNSGTF